MKKQSILLSLFLIITTIQTCQAGILTRLSIMIPTIYCGVKIYQADGDLEKTKRLMRKDKDARCDDLIKFIHEHCDHDLCKKMIEQLKQLKSKPSQQLEDTLQENWEIARDTTKNAIDESHKALTEKFNDINNQSKK